MQQMFFDFSLCSSAVWLRGVLGAGGATALPDDYGRRGLSGARGRLATHLLHQQAAAAEADQSPKAEDSGSTAGAAL